MPSICLRRRKYWIQYYLPGCPRPVRQSLGVEDHAQARRMADKLGHLLAWLDPRLADVELPREILETLPPLSLPAPVGMPPVSAQAAEPGPFNSKPRVKIPEAIRGYYAHVRESNQPRWVSVKVKVLRVLFGDRPVAEATGESFAKTPPEAGFFRGTALEEISSTLLAELVAARTARDGVSPASEKTKRHYREVLHDFFEYCLSHGLMEVRNLHTPNPVAALPSYLGKNEGIRFLRNTEETPEIDEQYAALGYNRSLHAAVTIMIEAGLRRSEALWLDKGAFSSDLRVMSVTTRHDDETDRGSTLKTHKSHRTVSVSPALRSFLEEYLPTLEGKWLVPSPRGGQWNADNFSTALRTANEAAGLPWTCLDYRHTFATRRAFLDKWTSIRLAREMGTSVTMIDKHYAAFLRHDE